MKDRESIAFIIADRDISIVQGSTEMYYVAREFGEHMETHSFAPTSKSIPGVETHSQPFDGVLGTLLLNVIYLPFWVYVSIVYRPKIVYCYQNIITPQLLMKLLCGATIVHDMQSDPCDQAKEFSSLNNANDMQAFLILLSKYAHQFALPRSDLVVALSEELRESLVVNYGIIDSKIHVMPLGVDTSKFNYNSKLGDDIRIVYIGSITEYRGLDEFIRGLEQMPEAEQEKISLHLYGSGDENFISSLQDRTKSNLFGFNWHGQVSHDRIPKALETADVAVSPLPQLEAYRVSSPAKVFEYLAAGLPIIASDIQPHKKILSEKECAILVDPQPTSYAEGVSTIVNNSDQIEEMSEKSYNLAKRHDWERRFTELFSAINSI